MRKNGCYFHVQHTKISLKRCFSSKHHEKSSFVDQCYLSTVNELQQLKKKKNELWSEIWSHMERESKEKSRKKIKMEVKHSHDKPKQ